MGAAPTWGSPAPGRAGWRPRRAPRSLPTALLTPPPSRTRALSWAATSLWPLARLSLQCAATPRSPWRPRLGSLLRPTLGITRMGRRPPRTCLHHQRLGCDLLGRQGVARAPPDDWGLHRGARGVSGALDPPGGCDFGLCGVGS